MDQTHHAHVSSALCYSIGMSIMPLVDGDFPALLWSYGVLWVMHLFVACSVRKHRTVLTSGRFSGLMNVSILSILYSVHSQLLKISLHHFLLLCHYCDSDLDPRPHAGF